MDLRTRLEHMRGKSILINGTRYEIDAAGIISGIKEADAAKLIRNPAWSTTDGTEPKAPKPKDEPTEPSMASAVIAAEERKLIPDPPPADEGVSEDETSDEWPDPTEDMDIEYLRQMADAYEVSYSGRTGAKTLVKKIRAEMYGDDA